MKDTIIHNLLEFVKPDYRMINNGKLYAKEYGLGKIKNAFGKEYYIFENFASDIKRSEFEPVLSFFNRIIPGFENKWIDGNSFKPVILDKIDYNTFICITSDIFIPNKEISNFIRKSNRNDSNSRYDANVYIYIFGKKSPKYIKEFEKVLEEVSIIKQKKKIAIITELSNDETEISTLSFDPRDMNTLVYSHNEMDIIKNHLDKFADSYSFYKYKQLLYKTGILLYGVPGTGKSTICKVLANLYGRNIVQVNIPTIDKINFGELTRLINNDDQKYIVLLEDIDTLYLNRDDDKIVDKDYNNIINNLLQFLDSNTSPDDVIFIATTNHVDRLDDALLRAGRFDLKVEVKGITGKDIDKMLDLFNLDISIKEEVIADYKKDVKDTNVDLYNQSRLQNILLQKIKNQTLKENNMEEEIPEYEDKESECEEWQENGGKNE